MSFFDRFKSQPHHGGKQEKAPVKVAPKQDKTSVAEEAPRAEKRAGKDDTREAYRVLLRPIVSEKAARVGEDRQYIFEVPTDVTRISVSRAIHALYGVRPAKVNIVRVKGKKVNFGRRAGKQKDWKKAMVTLRAGETISVYEGV